MQLFMFQFNTSVKLTTKKVAAVYKIVFDNGYYYIGATHDLYKRMYAHKTALNIGKKSLFDIAIQCGATSCEFIIIKIFKGDIGFRKKSKCFLLEKTLLHRKRNDKMLINRFLHIKKPKKYVSVAKVKNPKPKSQMWGNLP